VGVVADTKFRTLGERARSIFYWPYAQERFTWRLLLVRSSSPEAALGLIRQVTRELDKDLAISGLETLEEMIGRQALILPLTSARLFGILGLIGLIIAITGVYAVMAFSVSQRRHEIGIRLAIGADPGTVVRLVLRRGVVLTTLGVVLGVAGAFAVTWLLSWLLYDISSTDLVTFLVVPLMLAGVALTASWIPARRAADVDPLETLRSE
jgi:ABC-type antimicrobial peptide transport system permease subunit